MATFRADPYALSFAKKFETRTFDGLLHEVFLLPVEHFANDFLDKTTRWGRFGDNHIVIDNLGSANVGGHSVLVGTALHVRMRDLPSPYQASGAIPLQLAEDSGLGKHVAFLWDPEASHLWFQRDREALGLGAFLDYVRAKTDVSFKENAIFMPDATARARKLKQFKSIKLQLHAARSGQRAEPQQFRHIFDWEAIRRKYGAETITVEIKPGRGNFLGGETAQLVKETVDMFEQAEDGEVRNALLTGYPTKTPDPNEEEDVINLLRNRHLFAVDGVALERFRTPKTLMNLIKRLFRENRSIVSR